MYTELDINLLPPAGRDADPAMANPYANGLPDEKQQQLAKRYADIFGVIVKHRDSVSRVTFWGLSDADSWLNRGRMNYPLLWDRQRQPKPAFQAVVDVLQARTMSVLDLILNPAGRHDSIRFAPLAGAGRSSVASTSAQREPIRSAARVHAVSRQWHLRRRRDGRLDRDAGPTPPTYAYKWTIRRNNAVVLKEGTLDLPAARPRSRSSATSRR